MLRLVVNEAEKSDSILTDEGRMIKAVLDMQDTEVNKPHANQDILYCITHLGQISAGESHHAAPRGYHRSGRDCNGLGGNITSFPVFSHLASPLLTTGTDSSCCCDAADPDGRPGHALQPNTRLQRRRGQYNRRGLQQGPPQLHEPAG